MQNTVQLELIDQSILLELNGAELYRLFYEACPEDAEFWWRLYLEEKNHAALIRAAKESFSKIDKFPFHLISNSVETLKRDNARLEALIGQFKKSPPGRWQAFETAIELERMAGEAHYMAFMEKRAENSVESVFQQLNQADKDHARRIQAHYENRRGTKG